MHHLDDMLLKKIVHCLPALFARGNRRGQAIEGLIPIQGLVQELADCAMLFLRQRLGALGQVSRHFDRILVCTRRWPA
jgi:hypothetical protein